MLVLQLQLKLFFAVLEIDTSEQAFRKSINVPFSLKSLANHLKILESSAVSSLNLFEFHKPRAGAHELPFISTAIPSSSHFYFDSRFQASILVLRVSIVSVLSLGKFYQDTSNKNEKNSYIFLYFQSHHVSMLGKQMISSSTKILKLN